jgi:hypothetical protein
MMKKAFAEAGSSPPGIVLTLNFPGVRIIAILMGGDLYR